MAKDAGFLKYLDIPFSYALIALFFSVDWAQPQSITTMIFFTSVLASALEIIDPVVRVLKQYTFFKFRTRQLFTTKTARKFELLPITKKAVEIEALSKSKNKITGMIYFIIISLISYYRITSEQDLLNYQVNPMWANVLLVVVIAVAYLTIQEWTRFPKKVYIVDVLLLKIEGIIQEGNSFLHMQSAINEDDWVTARYYARKGFLDKDFAPDPEPIY